MVLPQVGAKSARWDEFLCLVSLIVAWNFRRCSMLRANCEVRWVSFFECQGGATDGSTGNLLRRRVIEFALHGTYRACGPFPWCSVEAAPRPVEPQAQRYTPLVQVILKSQFVTSRGQTSSPSFHDSPQAQLRRAKGLSQREVANTLKKRAGMPTGIPRTMSRSPSLATGPAMRSCRQGKRRLSVEKTW